MKLSLGPDKKTFILSLTFEQRAVARDAGFRWDDNIKAWKTTSQQIAAPFAIYADAETKTALNIINYLVAADTFTIPAGLYPYQIEGIRFILSRRNTLLGDEMGLGKTVQAIVAAQNIGGRVLIIAPAFLCINWQREVKQWTKQDATIVSPKGDTSTLDVYTRSVNWAIIPDSIIGRENILSVAKCFAPAVLIIDEAHRYKNPKAQRTIAVMEGLVGPSNRVIALTGTPMPNKPIELFPIITALNPAAFGFMSFFMFAKKYCAAHKTHWGWDFTGASNLDDLRQKLSSFTIRRLKANVLKDLPPKTNQLIFAELTAKAKKILKLEENFDVSEVEGGKYSLATFNELSKIRHELGLLKAEFALDYIDGLFDGGLQKLVVFCHHREVVAVLEKELQKYSPAVVVGGMTPDEKQVEVDRFQRLGACRLFIGNLQAAGVGLTLTAASHVLIIEPSWTPGENDQASDRCHRIGQKDNVTVQYLVYKGSLDERILTRHFEKLKVIERVFNHESKR